MYDLAYHKYIDGFICGAICYFFEKKTAIAFRKCNVNTIYIIYQELACFNQKFSY